MHVQRIDVELGIAATRSTSAPAPGAGRGTRPRDPARDVLLVTNTTVAPLYCRRLAARSTARCVEVVLPDGETHKTLANVNRCSTCWSPTASTRDACVVALGGGVVGDLAGFAAASYQRGVAFVQVPTTLLAQVDSSVGGKTGVNHPRGKNLIGAFHQPRPCSPTPTRCDTLPERELRAGLAEVDQVRPDRRPGLLRLARSDMPRLLARDAEALAHAIRRSCEIKAEIVARDEREQGERALLNLGHTFGHAIESATGYGDLAARRGGRRRHGAGGRPVRSASAG